MTEIARRRALLDPKPPRAEESDDEYEEACIVDGLVCFSTSHVGMGPVSDEPGRPLLRLYGSFQSAEEACAHTSCLVSAGVNVQLHPMREWFVVAASEKNLVDRRHVEAKIRDVLERDAEKAAARDESFRVQKQDGLDAGKQAATDLMDRLPVSEVNSSTTFEHKASLRTKTSLPFASAPPCRPDQAFAVVTMLADERFEDVPEPVCKVYAVARTKKQALSYVKRTLSSDVRDKDLDVVRLNEWLTPQQPENGRGADVYRDEELNRIMRSKKEEAHQIKKLESDAGNSGASPLGEDVTAAEHDRRKEE